MDYSVLTWGSSDAGGYSGAERAQLFEGVRGCPRAYKPYKDYKALQAFIRLYKPYKALIKDIKKYLTIFEYIQKVALPDWLPARLAAYTFWSLLLLLLMLLLGAVALAVAVAFAFAVAV